MTQKYSIHELATLARSVVNYYDSKNEDCNLTFIESEARMWEKELNYKKGSVITDIIPSKEKLAGMCFHLSDYYSRNGALSWAVQLRREGKWLAE